MLFLETVVNIVSPILREPSFYELFESVLELGRGKICLIRLKSLPIVAYKRNLSLRDILVHSSDSSSTEQPGCHACQRPRCQTCVFITPLSDIRGPKSTFTIRDHFTCTSIGKSCVLYLLPQMLPYLHRRNWAKSQESNWWAFAKHTQQQPCGTTFQLRRSQYYRCPGMRYAFVLRFQHPPQTTENEANISAGDRGAGWP